jgi:hypothetical protein
MTMKTWGSLALVVAIGLGFAPSGAEARHRRCGGSYGGGGSFGGSGSHGSGWSGDGSHGGRGSFGGVFSRHRRGGNCDCYAEESFGSNGGYGYNCGHGSGGGQGSSYYSDPGATVYESNDEPGQPPAAPRMSEEESNRNSNESAPPSSEAPQDRGI